jgi:Retinal pigment epithelial membrane protein
MILQQLVASLHATLQVIRSAQDSKSSQLYIYTKLVLSSPLQYA